MSSPNSISSSQSTNIYDIESASRNNEESIEISSSSSSSTSSSSTAPSYFHPEGELEGRTVTILRNTPEEISLMKRETCNDVARIVGIVVVVGGILTEIAGGVLFATPYAKLGFSVLALGGSICTFGGSMLLITHVQGNKIERQWNLLKKQKANEK